MGHRDKIRYVIGIDPGVATGFALRDVSTDEIIDVRSMLIHEAMYEVESLSLVSNIFVFVEDARQLKSYHPDNKNIGKWQGVGSVKRDCRIWEDYLKYLKIPFQMVKPKRKQTKITQKEFAKITGYGKRTNSHGRDAAMLTLLSIPKIPS